MKSRQRQMPRIVERMRGISLWVRYASTTSSTSEPPASTRNGLSKPVAAERFGSGAKDNSANTASEVTSVSRTVAISHHSRVHSRIA